MTVHLVHLHSGNPLESATSKACGRCMLAFTSQAVQLISISWGKGAIHEPFPREISQGFLSIREVNDLVGERILYSVHLVHHSPPLLLLGFRRRFRDVFREVKP